MAIIHCSLHMLIIYMYASNMWAELSPLSHGPGGGGGGGGSEGIMTV